MKDNNKTLIDVKNLGKVFGKKTPFEYCALNEINLKINQGDFIAIAGETGSGKSTLVTHFNGLIKPTSGELTTFDNRITYKTRKIKNIKELRNNIGMVFQFPEYQLFEDTVFKDITFGPKNFGQTKIEASLNAWKYIRILNIPREVVDRSPFELSGGQKRKVALAGILSIETQLIVFDEPTAGLDPESEAEVLELCKHLNELGKTIVIVTHNMDNILKYSNRVVIIKNGKVTQDTEPWMLFSNKKVVEENNLQMPQLYDFLHKYDHDFKKCKLLNNNDLIKYIFEKQKGKGK